MPVDLLTNPGALFGETYIGGGQVVEYYPNGDTVALTNGQLVSLIAIVAPSLGPATVKRSPTTADGFILGCVINAPTGGYPVGSPVAVCTRGFALALFIANTTAGHFANVGATTAGTFVDSATATNNLTMGTILSTVTVAGSALVPVYIGRT
jgi:hypothetical protein